MKRDLGCKFKSIFLHFKYVKIFNFKYLFNVAINLVLFLIFRFPKWHIFATRHNRAYKKEVIKAVLESNSDFHCEIGCGLGEIIGSISSIRETNFGIDIDATALRPASLLYKKVVFMNLDVFTQSGYNNLFSRIDKDQPLSGSFILVNWANTSQILDFIEIIRAFDWSTLKCFEIFFDVRTLDVEDQDEYSYIPSRSLISDLYGEEIITVDYERNICRAKIEIL